VVILDRAISPFLNLFIAVQLILLVVELLLEASQLFDEHIVIFFVYKRHLRLQEIEDVGLDARYFFHLTLQAV